MLKSATIRPINVDLLSEYAGRRVLVAGADGFLGVNCVAALAAAGAKITLLSRRDRPRAMVDGARHVKADLLDAAAIAAAVEGQAVVFDLAGVSGAVGSNIDPITSADKECRPHLTLFAAAAAAQSRPVLVFCSSRLVYGKPERLPVDEAHPTRPASFYAVHKLTLENYLHVLATTRGLRSCVVRLSNPYGPFWPTERKSYGLINQFISKALAGEPIDVFGDGGQRRDYIHVDDAIQAMLAIAPAANCWGETFNLGGPEAITIRQAVDAIAEAIPGTTIRTLAWPTEHLAVETGDYQTDMTKLRAYISLPPTLAFIEGLARTLARNAHA